eukprot:scaffold142271_cov31-Tisochrysis_lutea.AAC.1
MSDVNALPSLARLKMIQVAVSMADVRHTHGWPIATCESMAPRSSCSSAKHDNGDAITTHLGRNATNAHCP